MKRALCAALAAVLIAACAAFCASCAEGSPQGGPSSGETSGGRTAVSAETAETAGESAKSFASEESPGAKTTVFPEGTGDAEKTSAIPDEPDLTEKTPIPPEDSDLSGEKTPSLNGGEPSVTGEDPKELCVVSFETGTKELTLESLTVEKGSNVQAPTVIRKGYILRRWLANGREYDFSQPVTADVQLKAEWLERTNLPVTLVELKNEKGRSVSLSAVDRENWVQSVVTVMTEDGRYEANAVSSTFRGRGNGSWGEAKKGYRIRFDEKLRLFDCALNRHWVLLPSSGWSDLTLMRIPTSFNLAKSVFDGLEYLPNARFTDVYVNGRYHGVYLLCEQVRVGKGRVEIKSEYGVEDTGFLIEYDAYARGKEGIDWFDINDGGAELVTYKFTVHSPDPDDYAEAVSEKTYRAQVAYIKDYVRRVYTAAIIDRDFAALSELVDVGSLVDMYILEEFYKNTDAGWSSFYLYKKPGGKLYFGPPWDFDGTTLGARGEENDPNGIYVADSVRNYTPFGNTANELFVALYQNDEFLSLVKARWQELSPRIEEFYDTLFTERFYAQNRYAFGRNLVRWRYKGDANSQALAEEKWVGECRALKAWFDGRIAFLNGEWGQ